MKSQKAKKKKKKGICTKPCNMHFSSQSLIGNRTQSGTCFRSYKQYNDIAWLENDLFTFLDKALHFGMETVVSLKIICTVTLNNKLVTSIYVVVVGFISLSTAVLP